MKTAFSFLVFLLFILPAIIIGYVLEAIKVGYKTGTKLYYTNEDSAINKILTKNINY